VRWSIDYFPGCTHHAFLSHCREDRADLVIPVYEALTTTGVTAWLDQVDYTYGRDSRTALKDGVLYSRHVVFFVTPAMISTGRGWCVFELAFAELLQAALHRGEPLVNVFLPLFFLPQSDPALPRTVWQATRDRGNFLEPKRGPKAKARRVEWAVEQVVQFLGNEEKRSADMAARAAADRTFRQELAKPPGLLQRVTRFDPNPLTVRGGVGPALA
jgi:hypothetical protein